MKVINRMSDTEAIRDNRLRAIVKMIYLGDFMQVADEYSTRPGEYRPEELGRLVLIEEGDDVLGDNEEAAFLKESGGLMNYFPGTQDPVWEYVEHRWGMSKILRLLNDEYGIIYLVPDEVTLPTQVRNAIDEMREEVMD